MSAIAGLWHREGHPVHGADVDVMLDRLSHRGPDGRGRWQDLSMAIGHASLQVTPESRGERQPLADESTRTVLTFDGRLDNRDELLRALDHTGPWSSPASDAEIVLRACRAWGVDAPARFLGDFAFVFWDGARRTLLGARDARGMRPLCYRLDGHSLAWASQLHALVQAPFAQPPPNEGFIGEVLCGIINSTDETMFQGVFRLPPASRLVVTPTALRVEPYWRLDPRREVRYRDDREYDDHFLALVEEAVRCRVRTDAPVGVMMSGGIDSSIVAGVAARRLSRDGRPLPRAFSLTYPGHPCDERPFIEKAVRHVGLDATFVANPDVDPYEDEVERYRDLPTFAAGAASEPLLAAAAQRGIRVMLTGLGGDEWFSGHQSRYADLVRGLRLLRLFEQVRADVRADALDGWRRAIWNTVRPLVPDALLDGAKRAAGYAPIPRWIRPAFATRIGLRDRLYNVPRRFGFATHAQNEQYRQATLGLNLLGTEILDRSVSQFGMDAAHPLDDRRLMEFGLALPEEQRWRRGVRKAIMRRAAGDLVPPAVRARGENANYARPYEDAMARLAARARWSAPSAAFDEWVDRDVLLASHDRVRGLPDAVAWPYWMALSVRLWADTLLEHRRRAPCGESLPHQCPEHERKTRMSDEKRNRTRKESPEKRASGRGPRRPYKKPKITEYGSIARLTHGGGSTAKEGNTPKIKAGCL